MCENVDKKYMVHHLYTRFRHFLGTIRIWLGLS